jgi:phage replication O-like protein O
MVVERVRRPGMQQKPFVMFPKELCDALLRSSMPSSRKDIVWAVLRRTAGHFNREEAPIAQSLLATMTGLNRKTVKRALGDLLDQGVIKERLTYTSSRARVLAVNMDYESWGNYSVARRELSLSAEYSMETERSLREGSGMARMRGQRSPHRRRDIQDNDGFPSRSGAAAIVGSEAQVSEDWLRGWQREHDSAVAAAQGAPLDH